MNEKNCIKQVRKPGIDPGALLLATYLAAVTILFLLGLCSTARAVVAEEQTALTDAVHGGQLLLPQAGAQGFRQAPMLQMDVEIRVSGIVARTTLRQEFKNDSPCWSEALYVFPLPDESAVDHLQMQIGERIITGRVREKEEARATYEAAREAGRKATLLSQQRPNIFTTRVANIAPGETVTVEIRYQQMVLYRDHVFSLRFPMVVGPRYQPVGALPQAPANRPSDGEDSRPVAGLPTQNSLHSPIIPAGEKPVNPVRLHVELAAGMELSRIESLYHGISTSQRSADNSIIDICFNGQVRADRDFVLEWEPKDAQKPQVSLFSEQKNGATWMLLMVMPPSRSPQKPLARETVFILDISGSMAGTSIRQAKEALLLAVARMRPQDRFNIIAFNTATRSLFSAARPGSRENRQVAVSFIRQLRARGGTEIRPALERALDGRRDHARIRQLVFLTDGCVSNERELLSLIRSRRGDTRLFTVGIGSAPNSYFMTRAAAMGRGSATFIGSLDQIGDKMTSLFSMLEQPAVTDLALPGDHLLETLPSPLPDLYHGEPMVAVIKSDSLPDQLQLTGMESGTIPWQVRLDTAAMVNRPGIAVLWARKKIRNLMDDLSAGADPASIRKQVTSLALHNHLVSRYTSLVAVEEQITRPDGTPLSRQQVPINLPAGWQYTFAGGAATATPSTLLLYSGLLLLLMAAILTALRRMRQ